MDPRCRVTPEFFFARAATLTTIWILIFGRLDVLEAAAKAGEVAVSKSGLLNLVGDGALRGRNVPDQVKETRLRES